MTNTTNPEETPSSDTPISSANPSSSEEFTSSSVTSPTSYNPFPPIQLLANARLVTGASSITLTIERATSSSSAQSTSPTSTPIPEVSGDGVAPRVIAGVVVGVAIAVGLLTLATAFFFFRRKSKHQHRELGLSREKSGHGHSVAITAPSVGHKPKAQFVLEDHLSQSLDDRSITTKASNVRTYIEQYVENFYREKKISAKNIPDKMLEAVDSGLLPELASILMVDKRNQTATMKHCIAYFILSSISTPGDTQKTLLPPELASFVHDTILHCPKNSAFEPALSQWRRLSAHLRPKPSDDTTYIAQRDRRIEDAVETISRAFSPWRNPKHSDDSTIRSLTNILRSAADFDFVLFSQRTVFEWVWDPPQSNATNLIVLFPAMVKVADDDGQKLGIPRQLIEANTALFYRG